MGQAVQSIHMVGLRLELRLDARSKVEFHVALVREKRRFEDRPNIVQASRSRFRCPLPYHVDRRERVAIERVQRTALANHLGDAADHRYFDRREVLSGVGPRDVGGTGQIASTQYGDEARESLIDELVTEQLAQSRLGRRRSIEHGMTTKVDPCGHRKNLGVAFRNFMQIPGEVTAVGLNEGPAVVF